MIEQAKARQEACCNASETEYFGARPQIDTLMQRHNFCAGFYRGYAAALAAAPAQPVAEPANGTAYAAMPDERAAFEARFPVPGGVRWSGSGYVVEDDYINSYRCDRFIGQWAAWQARASSAPADSVLEDAARYRWIRGPVEESTRYSRWRIEYWDGPNGWQPMQRERMDSAIDAARKQGANHD